MPLLQLVHQNPAVGHPQADVGRRQPERSRDVDHGRHDLGIGRRTGFADHVHVELKVLAQAAPLLPLVAEQLGNREPTDRLLQGLRAGAHHAGQGRRHFRPQRDLTLPLVLKRVQLLHDFLAALLGVELERFQWGPVVLLEAVAARHVAPSGENVVAER